MLEMKKQSLSETFSVYLDRRMFRILLLGAISGFPWVLIGSSLSLWLKEEGLSRSTIGWAGLIFAVYAFNYLWAPIIDRVNKFSQIIGFILIAQIVLGVLTLLSGAQMIVSSMHQISSIFLVSSSIYLVYLNLNTNLQLSD